MVECYFKVLKLGHQFELQFFMWGTSCSCSCS